MHLKQGTILYGEKFNYTIQKVLGQGTFGITYLASLEIKGSLGTLSGNTLVAIKEFFMKDINGREDAAVTCESRSGLYEYYKRKFAREANNLSKLKHPNIVKVMELFEANNTAYYVMEYVDGGNLNDCIEERQGLTESETLNYFKGIASALAYMHRHKMLHLDLKPSNIMLRKNGEVVLIDFGLSKQYDERGIAESSTSIGGGTPGYAPIEQISYHYGDGFPATMDVYALGATLFKMLTGVRPPEAWELLDERFPYDSFKTKKIRHETIDIIAKAMSPIKRDRYQNVEHFMTEYINSCTEETINTAISSKHDDEDEKTIIVEVTEPKTASKKIGYFFRTRNWFVNCVLLAALIVVACVGIGTTVMLESDALVIGINVLTTMSILLGLLYLFINKRYGFNCILLSLSVECLMMDWFWGYFDIAYINFIWYMSVTAVVAMTLFIRKDNVAAWSRLERNKSSKNKYTRIVTSILIIMTFLSQVVYPISVSSKMSGREWTRYEDVIDIYEANQDARRHYQTNI